MEAHAATVTRPRPERGMGVYSAKVGMWVFLASEVMFFASLIGSYVILRFGAAESWPRPGEVLNVPVTAVNTFILICSSVTMVKAYAAAEAGENDAIWKWLLATFLIGSTFLGVQVYEYLELAHHGFLPSSGLYGSSFYTMTGFHGFHVLLGVSCVLYTTIMAYRGRYDDGNYRSVEVMGLYWHFVDLVWIILFTVVYLI